MAWREVAVDSRGVGGCFTMVKGGGAAVSGRLEAGTEARPTGIFFTAW
jgi:hypothetical protein